eukprot:1530843-Pyramimonas_sp.AAC.1
MEADCSSLQAEVAQAQQAVAAAASEAGASVSSPPLANVLAAAQQLQAILQQARAGTTQMDGAQLLSTIEQRATNIGSIAA